MSCPDCGAPAPGGAKLCPACGFPLVLQSRGEAGTAPPLDLLRKPGEAVAPVAEPAARVATTSRSPVARPAPPAAGLGCRACGHVSAPVRVRCERCGAPLRAVELPYREVPAAGPPPVRRRPWWPVAAAVAAVLLVGGGTGFLLTREDAPPPRTGDTVTGGTPAAQPVRVPAAAVTGTASSTKKPLWAYRIENSLDGDRGTSWNSDGRRDGTGKGTVLTYTFDRPRHIVGLTLINGYAESKKLRRVWEANGRLQRVVISSGTAARDLSLADTVEPQSIQADLGTTRTVRIEVRSVVKGDRFPDLALTDIAFDELP